MNQNAIIVDIDGTVADGGDRSPYDYENVDKDKPIYRIVELVRHLRRKYFIIFVSGREETCRVKTQLWIWKHIKVNSFELFMRKEKDYRQDAIIKQEIYENEIEGKYNIHFVLDDRDQVVAMWRKKGLTCLQVDYGDF